MATRRKTDHLERIAVLETKVESMSSDLSSINTKLDAITISLSRNKGFWGAVILVMSAVWTLVSQWGHKLAELFTSSPKA